MPTCGQPYIVVEIVIKVLLYEDVSGLFDKWSLYVVQPMIDAPEIEGDVFSQVADGDFELRKAIEDAVGDHTEEMQRMHQACCDGS